MPVQPTLYPLIRPEDKLEPFFRKVSNYTMKLQDRFDRLDKSLPVRRQVENIRKLDDKVLRFLSFLHSLQLQLMNPFDYFMVDDPTVPKSLRSVYKEFRDFLAPLDSNNYNKFFQKIVSFLQKQTRLVSDLSDKIIGASFSVRGSGLFRSLQQQQQQKQQRLLTFSQQDELDPPPQLVRY